VARARRAPSKRKGAWKPRKLPIQARSRATFDAILQACARILRESGLTAVTTNAVAERAGVSIGSLYEFFPSREAILATLVQQRLEALAPAVESTLEEASTLDPASGVRLLIGRLIEAVAADRALFRVLLRDAPALRALPETKRAMAGFFEIGRAGAARSPRLALPFPEADTWLIGRMVANAVLEIAFLEAEAPDRSVLAGELARLTYRMLRARDIDEEAPRREARPRARRPAPARAPR
jgi:AcrR family transcriptional regulator